MRERGGETETEDRENKFWHGQSRKLALSFERPLKEEQRGGEDCSIPYGRTSRKTCSGALSEQLGKQTWPHNIRPALKDFELLQQQEGIKDGNISGKMKFSIGCFFLDQLAIL